MKCTYEKVDENYNVIECPVNDTNGAITGKIVIGLSTWFDEHPEERIALGWIKHLHPPIDVEYDDQTQYVVITTREIDAYTIEDVYHILDKSEEMMLLEELTEQHRSSFLIV